MIHISTIVKPLATRHEYWEEVKFNLPIGDRDRKPYYVCYEYQTATREEKSCENCGNFHFVNTEIRFECGAKFGCDTHDSWIPKPTATEVTVHADVSNTWKYLQRESEE